MELPWFLPGASGYDHHAERSGRREPICARVGNGGERHGALARDEVEGEGAVVTDRDAPALVREHDLAVILARGATIVAGSRVSTLVQVMPLSALRKALPRNPNTSTASPAPTTPNRLPRVVHATPIRIGEPRDRA